MTPQEKVQRLFAQLTARYGELELKPGQTIQAIEASWSRAIGHYSAKHVIAGMATYMRETKYARWPNEAEFLAILSDMGAEPDTEQGKQVIPEHIKVAQRDAGAWYRGLLDIPMPSHWFPFGYEEALLDIIGTKRGENSRKGFAQLLTEAWLRGDLRRWHEAAEEWNREAQAQKASYYAARERLGHCYVNEHKGPVA